MDQSIKLLCFVLISHYAVQGVFSNPQNALRRPKVDQSKGQDCTNHLQIIDNCISKTTYSYIPNYNSHPTTANELQASCQVIPDNLKCLRNYSKCLNSLGKRIIIAFVTGRSKHSKKICANINDPKSIQFYKSNECMKKTNKGPALATLEKEFGSSFQYLAKNKTMSFDDRFHMACCQTSDNRLKVLASYEPECSELVDAQAEYIDSMVGDLLGIACPESKRLKEICSKLPVLPKSRVWTPTTVNRAALDFIVALSEQDEKKKANQ